ncbi:MAG: putative transporter substrate-binding protein [Desertimonas sp.]|nr:putative transporter substrate-binding protein [Desertimonas sp.]
MTRTRRSIGAAVAAMALVAVAATQHAGASAEDVTLSYFTFSAAPDHLEDLDSIVAAFEAEHPNVQVEVQTAAYADYFTSLQTQIAGGSAPDTFELNYENFVTYARSGALLDLGSYVGDGIDPARYYPLALEGFTDGGTQYGLPATFSNVVLIYNKTLFDEAGLDYPTAEWTWAEYTAAAETLTDVEAGVYGGFQPVSFFEFYKSLAQAGGMFFDADGNAAFNSPEGVAAAEWLTSKPGTVMPTLADIGGTPDFDTALFTSGKLAMWHNGIWQFAGLNESGVDYDIVVEPGDAQQANAVFMNGAVASARTDHPDEAALWIAFLTGSPTTVDTRLASSWELPAVSDEEAFASYLEITPPDNRQAVFDALDHIALPPVIERQQEMQDIVTQALERIVADGADIQEALDQAAAEVDGLTG